MRFCVSFLLPVVIIDLVVKELKLSARSSHLFHRLVLSLIPMCDRLCRSPAVVVSEPAALVSHKQSFGPPQIKPVVAHGERAIIFSVICLPVADNNRQAVGMHFQEQDGD